MKARIESAGQVASVVRLGRHRLVFDQPGTRPGGDDRGPSPLDVMAAAVGACAHYYAAAFLYARGLPTDALTVDVTWEKDRTPVPRLGRLVIAVGLPSGLGERDVAAITRAIEACPAYGTLRYPPDVRFEIGAAEPGTIEQVNGTDADAALVAAARRGESAALEQLLERYQDRIFGFGLRMCGDEEDAKDVLQETLLAASRGLARFRGEASVSTWLYTIAKRSCMKHRRRSRFAPARTESLDRKAADVADPGPGPHERAERSEVKRALVRALASLDPSSREAIVLRDIEGLSAAEAAAVAGVSVAALKSRLHRARAAVALHLAGARGRAPQARRPDCPDVVRALSTQIEGDLSPARCAELERHVQSCAACRARCDGLKRALAACRSARVRAPGRVSTEVFASMRASGPAARRRRA